MQPHTILIVDDEADNRTLLELMLKREGYTVATASNGEEALVAIGHTRPDLVLLDVIMPDLSGYQVATTMKANPATKGITIVMISALNDRNAKLLALDSGADAFLSKRLSSPEICQSIRELLAARPKPAE